MSDGESDGRGPLIYTAGYALRPTSHPLSAPNASVRLLNGPSTGPPDGPMSAHQ